MCSSDLRLLKYPMPYEDLPHGRDEKTHDRNQPAIKYSKKALAVYCIRDTHSFDQRPMKRISKEDPVGVELQKIYSQNKTCLLYTSLVY